MYFFVLLFISNLLSRASQFRPNKQTVYFFCAIQCTFMPMVIICWAADRPSTKKNLICYLNFKYPDILMSVNTQKIVLFLSYHGRNIKLMTNICAISRSIWESCFNKAWGNILHFGGVWGGAGEAVWGIMPTKAICGCWCSDHPFDSTGTLKHIPEALHYSIPNCGVWKQAMYTTSWTVPDKAK